MDPLKMVKKILAKSTVIICDNVDPTSFLGKMEADDALTHNDVQLIECEKTPRNKSNKLLDILRYKETTAYDVFMDALKEANGQIYAKVVEIESNVGYSRPGSDLSTGPTQPAPAPGHTQPAPAPGAQQVSNDDLLEIAYNAGLTKANMDALFLALGLSQADIDNGRSNANTDDIHLQAFRVLNDEWLKKKGKAATRQVILGALKRFRMTVALEYLQQTWGMST